MTALPPKHDIGQAWSQAVWPRREGADPEPPSDPYAMRSGRWYSQQTLYGNDTTSITLIPNSVYAVPVRITGACTLAALRAVVLTGAGSTALLGVYANTPANRPGAKLAGGSINPGTAGTKTAAISLAIAEACIVWVALNCDSNSTVWSAAVGALPTLYGGSSIAPVSMIAMAVGSLALANPFPGPVTFWDGGGPVKSPLLAVVTA